MAAMPPSSDSDHQDLPSWLKRHMQMAATRACQADATCLYRWKQQYCVQLRIDELKQVVYLYRVRACEGAMRS
jgi:hypothetical protein